VKNGMRLKVKSDKKFTAKSDIKLFGKTGIWTKNMLILPNRYAESIGAKLFNYGCEVVYF
jgi:hypothetical protein